ncbi:tetratricopeptide repeat protein [Pontiellaceae bacterium B1224]|nr:tetratricopeptide repeat protein [Pontiellaceae bacterium B1224]
MKRVWIGLLTGCLLVGCATTEKSPPLTPLTPEIAWGVQQQQSEVSYDQAIELLAQGRQLDAEAIAFEAAEQYSGSQRLQFLSGVLLRSRFETSTAVGFFARTQELGANTVLSRAASITVSMDLGLVTETGFRALEKLIDDYPDELLIRWLYAIEATARGLHIEEGKRQFEYILKEWSMGPIMVHQSYARLLSVELDEPEQALEHRMLAAELEPNAETYQGLANTLKQLQRYEDADNVYSKLVEMDSENQIVWIQWGTCLFYQEDYAAAEAKFEQAYKLYPDDVFSLVFQGRCLEKQGRPEEGFKKYQQAVEAVPSHVPARAYVAHSKLYGYGTTPDIEGALEDCVEPGSTKMDQLRKRVRMGNESDNPLAPEKSEELLKHLIALGNAGNPEAAYNLGMIYRYGIGVPEDESVALDWFRRAAENGHEISMRLMNPPE